MHKKTVALTAILALTGLVTLGNSCLPRPAITLQKYFYYERLNPDLFPGTNALPAEGLPVDVSYAYQGIGYKWHFVTDKNGLVELAGVPTGDYHFNWTWNGEAKQETLSICCAKKVWVFTNFVEAKGRGT